VRFDHAATVVFDFSRLEKPASPQFVLSAARVEFEQTAFLADGFLWVREALIQLGQVRVFQAGLALAEDLALFKEKSVHFFAYTEGLLVVWAQQECHEFCGAEGF
jgi:hypothetical protein